MAVPESRANGGETMRQVACARQLLPIFYPQDLLLLFPSSLKQTVRRASG